MTDARRLAVVLSVLGVVLTGVALAAAMSTEIVVMPPPLRVTTTPAVPLFSKAVKFADAN